MSIHSCVFCKIVNKNISAVIVEETSDFLVIQDHHPKAPIHYLFVPKHHYADIRDIPKEKTALLAHMFELVHRVISDRLHNGPCKLVMNNGVEVGQSVFHMHMHMLAGGTSAEIEAI